MRRQQHEVAPAVICRLMALTTSNSSKSPDGKRTGTTSSSLRRPWPLRMLCSAVVITPVYAISSSPQGKTAVTMGIAFKRSIMPCLK